VKRPSVRIVIGRVRMTRTGLIRALARPRRRAAIKAMASEENSMPEMRRATIRSESVLRSQRIIMDIC
jgi:hypothetical protein